MIDENPKVIKHLENTDTACMYGDLGNIEFLNEINVQESKMMISTIKNFDEDMLLLKTMKKANKNLIIFAPRKNGGLAQLARAFDWQSKGHRFDSDILHRKRKQLQF